MHRLVALLPSLLISAFSPPMTAAPQETRSSSAPQALHELFSAAWDYQMQEDPARASTLGDRRWNDRWPDMTPQAFRKRREHATEVLARLQRIDRASLAPADQLNYDLFKREYELKVEEQEYRWYLVPLDQREGIQTRAELADLLRFETVKDYEGWLARLRGFPAYMDGTIALMREGIRARMVQPKLVMRRVQGQVDKHLASTAEASPFYKPFKSLPASVPESARARLAQDAREAITSAVVPAFRRFKQFLADEYVPAAFDQVGIWQAPGGDETYRFLARKHTTTRLTPEQIHEIGLAEVSRIRAEMQRIMASAGFTGTLPEYFKLLRTDPRFYYKTPEELITAYRAIAKRIDPALVAVFKTLPRTPYGVEAIPEITAPDTTTAYYQEPAADGSRAGTYYVNLYKPETRPRYEMMVLSLHEAVPGHHLQIALAMEQSEMPKFRRHAGDTAFVEGWALYAESLGDEMGLYGDPHLKFGQLTYEMWRAVRLVVDTGIHAMRWDRQRAIDFFAMNAAKTENDIVNEVDRYIAWPGQALAYKIGELKIKELRRRASGALGEQFDLREFHDVVLRNGALPLDVLEEIVDGWIASRGGVRGFEGSRVRRFGGCEGAKVRGCEGARVRRFEGSRVRRCEGSRLLTTEECLMTEVERIADQLRRALEGRAWHGPALRELLADVNVDQAVRRPLDRAHTIWELVLHVTVWVDEVRRRLMRGEVRDLAPEEDWPAVSDTSEAAWKKALAQLDRAHRDLHEVLAKLSDARLDDPVSVERGVRYTVYITLHGVIQHDLYHAGQIAVLKKGL